MPPPQKQQRTLSVKGKKLNDRVAKLARDAQRADGTSIGVRTGKSIDTVRRLVIKNNPNPKHQVF
jgi:hypothetical protein